MHLASPRRLANYLLLEVLSYDGGMGVVYRSIHDRLKVPRAVKVLKADVVRSKYGLNRFHREIETVAKLDHPNIVKAYDAGEVDGEHYLVMELLDGVNLSRVVASQGALPVADACELVRQAALGLQHAHEHGLVHRDIKPSNLMLCRSGTLKVVDLGLARLAECGPNEESLTASNEIVGTVDYMAPEQGLVDGAVDIRSDIYSLGCTLFKLLTGEAPFSGPEYESAKKKLRGHASSAPRSIEMLRADLPESLIQCLQRLMAKSPADRIATPLEVADLIQPYCAGNDLPKLAADCLPQESEVPDFRTMTTEGPRGSITLETTLCDPGRDFTTEPETDLVTTERNGSEPVETIGGLSYPKPSALLDDDFVRASGTTTWLRRLVEEGLKSCSRLSRIERVLLLGAMVLLATCLAGALIYRPRIESGAPDGINSSITPTPGVTFHVLRDGNPHAVRWPTPVRNSQWHHNRATESLQVSSEDHAIIALGDSWDTRKYDFEVSIHQNQWANNIGIFFGWHPSQEENVNLTRFQSIQVRPDPDHAGQFRLYRSFEMMIIPTNTIQRRDLASSPIPSPDLNEEHSLSISVGELGLERVQWDGQEIGGLADPIPQFQIALTDADYRGLFGVVAEATSGTFRKAGYLQYPENESAKPKVAPVEKNTR